MFPKYVFFNILKWIEGKWPCQLIGTMYGFHIMSTSNFRLPDHILTFSPPVCTLNVGRTNLVEAVPTTVSVTCGNALLPSGHNVTSTNTGEAATIRQPEEHPGLLMAIC